MHDLFVNINNWFQSMGVWGLAMNSCIEKWNLVTPWFNKTIKQVLDEWQLTNDLACEKGHLGHCYAQSKWNGEILSEDNKKQLYIPPKLNVWNYYITVVKFNKARKVICTFFIFINFHCKRIISMTKNKEYITIYICIL